ncbi:hypothetical protein CPM_0968 [Cuniculiplasma divulgatum]|uniref:Uncharacterized protein n=1 Tax=Cuniculiplasma divulgatum TaxID=1673428 RepID=A0A1R4A770_9ARCH|nr:hypothetical protein CPM_0968 [Cuniculiplasma divulgatum]
MPLYSRIQVYRFLSNEKYPKKVIENLIFAYYNKQKIRILIITVSNFLI